MRINEIDVGSEEKLFATGGFLPRVEVEEIKPALRKLDNNFLAWSNLDLREIAREDTDMMEEFSDWTTSGIVDARTGDAVAFIAWEEAYRGALSNSVYIRQVEVNKKYRGRGLAKILYQSVRRQYNMLSDELQTPNGARMWSGMVRSGLPVQGYVYFGSGRSPEEVDSDTGGIKCQGKRFSVVEELQKIGAKQIKTDHRHPVYAFSVTDQRGFVDTPTKSPLRVYHKCDYSNTWETGLMVVKG